MSDADKAYAEAERLIEAARESGAAGLSLDRDDTHALTELPPGIARLTGLKNLDLDKTQVSDLSPLSGLMGLTLLWLNRTPVSDLSPLSGLTGLRELLLGGTSVSDLSPLSGLTGLTRLWLHSTSVTDLSPLSGLMGLTELGLKGTSVSDLSPLSGLTGLTELGLDGTPVSDIRPIRGLRRLVEEPGLFGLRFKNCASAKADPKIAEIAEIEDHSERARALFDYLEDWEPPGEGGQEPDPLMPVELRDERLEIPATTPSEAEVEERLKQVLYEQLREKAAELARAAGNRFPKLAARARQLQVQLEPDFAETDLLSLHLAVEDLRTLSDLGAEKEGDPFPEEVTIPLTEVVSRGPGLTLGNPLVDTLVERANRRRAAEPEPEAVQQAQDGMSAAVSEDEAAIGERLRALEAQVLGGPNAEAQEVQRAANRNILWRIGVGALSAGGKAGGMVATIALEKALGPSIGAFVQTNLPILAEAAATYGPGFQGWFLGVMSQVQELTRAVDDYRKTRGKDL